MMCDISANTVFRVPKIAPLVAMCPQWFTSALVGTNVGKEILKTTHEAFLFVCLLVGATPE
jgi:hypothetical protein